MFAGLYAQGIGIWMGGQAFINMKRPLMLAVTFGLAHLSTTQLEARCIAIGKILSDRVRVRQRKGIA